MGSGQKADARLIGQFGVGFYSAFVVADRVTVLTRRAGAAPDEGVKWESDGRGEYTLEAANLPERGTTVVLHLKEGEDEFLDGWKLRGLVRKYSDHVAFPIRMPKEAPAAEDNEDDDRKADATPEWETANDASALWSRPKSERTDDEYQAFYKSLGHDLNDDAAWTPNRADGSQYFRTPHYLQAYHSIALT